MSQSDNNMQMTILLFGMIEMIIGFSGVILADFFHVFNLLTILSALAGFAALFSCILHPSKIKPYDILGMALVLAYGVGTLNSLVSNSLDGLDLLKSSSVEEYWLTRTLGLATAAAGFLHVFGTIDKNAYIFQHINIKEDDKNRAVKLLLGVLILALIYIATGKIGIGGALTIAKGYVNISPSASIIKDLLLPVGASLFYVGLMSGNKNFKRFIITLTLFLLLIQFGLGRRPFVFATIVYLMVYFFATQRQRILTLRNVVIFITVIISFQILTTTYSSMRMALNIHKNEQQTKSVLDILPEALEVYRDSERNYLYETMHDNLRSRTFVLEYLAILDRALTTKEPMYGVNLNRALIIAAPSILFPSKYQNDLFFYSEEGVFGLNFKIIITDNANTVLTASLGDFGEAGLFILPVIFCVIFSAILRVSRRLSSPLGAMMISFFIAYRLLSVEEDIVSYFTNIRFIIILGVISWLVFSFNKKIQTKQN